MVKLVSACALVLLACQAALADGMPYQPYRHRGFYLPPERHVIEVVRYGHVYIINGFRFVAPSSCPGWTAGDRIWLLEGSWHAACDVAVFYNATRCNTCALLCG